MKICVIVYTIITLLEYSEGVNMNQQEIKQVADNLNKEECRKLVSVLNIKSNDKPIETNKIQEKISNDIPCIQMLLRWNYRKDQVGEDAHEVIFNRLNLIGRHDLADKVVLQHIKRDSNLNYDFNKFANEQTKEHIRNPDHSFHKLINTQEYNFSFVCGVIIFAIIIITCLIIYNKYQKSQLFR